MSKSGHDFTVGDHVVYPAHGVGQVQGIETQEVAGLKLEVYVITFDHEKMTLRVPVNKADSVGMRKLSSDKTMLAALETLKGKPKVKRTMWSRRAQESPGCLPAKCLDLICRRPRNRNDVLGRFLQ